MAPGAGQRARVLGEAADNSVKTTTSAGDMASGFRAMSRGSKGKRVGAHHIVRSLVVRRKIQGGGRRGSPAKQPLAQETGPAADLEH